MSFQMESTKGNDWRISSKSQIMVETIRKVLTSWNCYRHRDALLSSLGLDVPKKSPHLYPQQQPQPEMESSAGQLAGKAQMSREDAKKRKAVRRREKDLRRVEPVRKSRRVAERAGRVKDGNGGGDGDGDDQNPLSSSFLSSRKPSNSTNGYMDPLPKAIAPTLPPGPEYSSGQIEREKQPRPVKGDDGRLVFEGRWGGVFTPNVTPEEMFGGGAFGGSFFRCVNLILFRC